LTRFCSCPGPEVVQKLAAKDAAENLDRDEVVFATGNPAAAVGREITTGDNAVEMGMMGERLPPRMKDGEHADACTEMLWVGGDLEQRIGGRAKQDVADDAFVLQCRRTEFRGQCEDDVEVTHRRSRSRERASNQRARARAWHFGQWRLRHEF